MELTRVIKSFYRTEKSYLLSSGEIKKYLFIVDNNANKHLIKQAFYAIYNIKPSNVNIVKHKEKHVRTGTKTPGYKKGFKIAYVTLPKGMEITFDENENPEEKK